MEFICIPTHATERLCFCTSRLTIKLVILKKKNRQVLLHGGDEETRSVATVAGEGELREETAPHL